MLFILDWYQTKDGWAPVAQSSKRCRFAILNIVFLYLPPRQSLNSIDTEGFIQSKMFQVTFRDNGQVLCQLSSTFHFYTISSLLIDDSYVRNCPLWWFTLGYSSERYFVFTHGGVGHTDWYPSLWRLRRISPVPVSRFPGVINCRLPLRKLNAIHGCTTFMYLEWQHSN